MLTGLDQRHTLLFLTPEGRRRAWESRERPQEGDEALWAAYPEVPAILAAQTGDVPQGWLRVGFSYPVREGGARRRMAAWVPAGTVAETASPWDVMGRRPRLPEAVGDLLSRLEASAEGLGLDLGLFGSAQMEAVTGFSYLHHGSDLDIIIKGNSPQALLAFGAALTQAEAVLGVLADAEVRLDGLGDAKLKELLSGRKTVLVKALQGPAVISRSRAWDALGGTDK